MWSAIVTLALNIVKWIFGGRQQAEGEALGKSEQADAGITQELKNVEDANNAAAGLRNDPADILRDPENRDGPNYRGG